MTKYIEDRERVGQALSKWHEAGKPIVDSDAFHNICDEFDISAAWLEDAICELDHDDGIEFDPYQDEREHGWLAKF